MKLSKISMGIVALCGLAAVPAFAITADQYSAAAAMEIYMSGATAQDAGVQSAVTALCTPGTLHKYTATNQFAYLCTANPAKITLGGGRTQLAVFKNSVGGSGQGVAPVNNGTLLAYLEPSLINVANCATFQGAGAGPTEVACAAGAVGGATHASQIGISDLEPSFFGAATGTYDQLNAAPLATVIFGVPVTQVAYAALQTAQTTTGVPTLTSAQITTLYTKEPTFWSSVVPGMVIPGTTAGTDDFAFVARRVDSSGTQKTFEAVIARTVNGNAGGKSCYSKLPIFVTGAVALDNTAAIAACDGTAVAVNNSGTGQVQACLDTHNTGGRGAIGVLTTEQVGTGNYKHVRVNGVLPNYTNVKSGAYTNYGDSSLNTRKAPNAPDADHAAFLTGFKSNFAVSPTLHSDFGLTTTDNGKAGLITLNSVTGQSGGNPWVRLDSDGIVDNCVPGKLP